MLVGSWARQLSLRIIIIVIIFIDPIPVTIHSLAHSIVGTSSAKCPRLLVGIRRRRSNLLFSLILNAIDMILLHVITSHTDRPAI